MTWGDWIALAGLTGLSMAFFFGARRARNQARGAVTRCLVVEDRIRKALAGFGDEIEGQ